jgi:tetratricopeptide (TPR) repeat protein
MLAAARTSLKRGDFTEAAQVFSEALATAERQREQSAEAECHLGLASALAGLRQLDLAREHVERARALAGRASDPCHLAQVSQVLGLIEYYQRGLAAARAHFLEGHRLMKQHGQPDLSLTGSLLLNLGNTYQEMGDFAEATRWFREALSVLEPTQDLHRIGLAHVQLGAAQRDSGNHEAALAHLARAEHIFELLEDIHRLAQARTSMGIMLLERGEIDEAIEHFRYSLRIKERIGDDSGRGRTLTEMARALTAKRAFQDAEQALAEADRVARQLTDTTEAARIQLVRARLFREQGHLTEAIRQYKQAISSFDRLGMLVNLASACNELGDLLIQQKRPSEAAPYLARALQELKTAGRGPGTR